MGRSAYNASPCRYCGKHVTNAGFARHAHNMMHVREGKLVYMERFFYAFEMSDNRSRIDKVFVEPKSVEEYKSKGYRIPKPKKT